MPLPLLLTSALALAQADPVALDDLEVTLPDRVLFDAATDGAQWALGRSYKASAGASGLRFLPYLGSDAPGVQATFELRSVTAAGEELELEAPVARREGTSLVLDRGTVVERYACSVDAIEQILEVDLEGLSGALRIDFDVRTDLARPSRSHAPFRFGGSDAAVDVGEAFVLSEGGSKLAIESIRTPNGYALVVPESVVAGAGDSLVIDPVITSEVLFGNPPRPWVVADVASYGNDFFLVVERAFNATDSDVIVYKAPTLGGGPLAFVAAVDFTAVNYEEPAIAAISATDEIMVVATRGAGADRRIYARRTSADGLSVGPLYQVSSPDVESYGADIGAETGGPPLNRRFMAVWNNAFFGTTNVYVRALSGDAPVGDSVRIDALSDRSSLPAISTGSGQPGTFDARRFRLAYKRTSSTGAESIWTADVDRNATITTPRWQVASAIDTQQVSVSSSNSSRLQDGSVTYMVVWDSGPNFLGDIFAATCADGSVRGAVANVSLMSDERRTAEQRRPTVAATQEKFLITYQDRAFQGAWQVYMCSGTPAPESFGLGERNQVLLAAGAPQRNAAVATFFEGGVTGAFGEYGYAAWVNESGATQLEGGYVRSAFGLGVAGTQYCSAATNSSGVRGWITALGNGKVASPHEIVCSGMPVAVPCFVLTARDTAFVPQVGGSAGNLCLGGTGFGRFSNEVALTSADGVYTLSLDPRKIAQPGGTVSAVAGETWHFQGWFRDAGPTGITSNLTNGVAVEFVP
ncbi:MAG: hypothetical protein AAGB93_07690 [Planctomycetota bacterium]